VSRFGWVALFALGLTGGGTRADTSAPLAETTVGMSARLDGVVLPGPELEAKPATDRKAAVVLRVVAVYPHGTAFRYDLEYSGLEPGTHDLRDSLRRKDGSPLTGVQPLVVKVNPVRPPGQVEPNKLEIETGPRLGGYWWLSRGLLAVWALGGLAILLSFFFPRRRKTKAVSDTPVSLADRLRPLVEKATAGTLSRVELAGLERGLLAYWRKRLGLESAEPGAAIESLRKHPQAGPLLAHLEAWLHRPGPPEPVDVPRLLAPYRDLPPEAVDLNETGAAR
jgi:hypothetical protein